MNKLLERIAKDPRLFGPIIAIGLVWGSFLAVVVSRYPEGQAPDWVVVQLLPAMFSLVIGGLALNSWFRFQTFRRDPQQRQKHIEDLTKSLKASLETIELIRREIEEGDALVKDLESSSGRRTTGGVEEGRSRGRG